MLCFYMLSGFIGTRSIDEKSELGWPELADKWLTKIEATVGFWGIIFITLGLLMVWAVVKIAPALLDFKLKKYQVDKEIEIKRQEVAKILPPPAKKKLKPTKNIRSI